MKRKTFWRKFEKPINYIMRTYLTSFVFVLMFNSGLKMSGRENLILKSRIIRFVFLSDFTFYGNHESLNIILFLGPFI